MAQDLDKKLRTPLSPPPGDATRDFTPADGGTCDLPPADGGTCDLPPADGGTCDLPPADGGTCDLPAPADDGLTRDFAPGSSPVRTTTVPRQGDTVGRSSAPPSHGATIDFPSTNAPVTALKPGDVTCDVPSVGAPKLGDQTRLGTPGVLTQSAPAGASAVVPAAQKSAGRYLFKKFHAKGGMGEVWLAQDPDIGRPVALKRMLKGRDKQAPPVLAGSPRHRTA